MFYDRLTRTLHLFIATAILGQVILSEVMVYPKPGRPSDFFYGVHETLGQVILLLLVAHWIWCMVRSGDIAFSLLFPWFSPPRYLAIWEDIKRHSTYIIQFRLPADTQASPLPRAIHGLGLSVSTLLGLTGTILFFFMEKNGEMAGWVHDIKEVHETFGGLMWVYLIAHAGMGILHQVSGHGNLWAMVKVWEKNP